MTDAQLVSLLTGKSPREFSPAELAALREQWPQSADVRQALLDHLRLETDLISGLAEVTIDVDRLMARAAQRVPTSRSWKYAGVWLCAGLVLIAIGVWWRWDRTKRGPQNPVAATPNSLSSPIENSQSVPGVETPSQTAATNEKPGTDSPPPVKPSLEPAPWDAPELQSVAL